MHVCPAESVCINETTYIASSATDCTTVASVYNSTDYLDYCLPSDTTSSAWTLLQPSVRQPAVRCSHVMMRRYVPEAHTCSRQFLTRLLLCACCSNLCFIDKLLQATVIPSSVRLPASH